YADGRSLKDIAATLNAERIRAPHDGGRGHKLSPGWCHTTIRSLLRNRQYIGEWTWNKEKWLQVPGTRRYRRLPRPPSEPGTRTIPELRLVPDPLWRAVQLRFTRRRPGSGRTVGSGKDGGPLLSGLLRCGACGGSITVVSRRYKKGVAYTNLGC